MTTATAWNPSFDPRTAGQRIITPSGVTGAVGTDSNLTLPDPDAWLCNHAGGWCTPSFSIISEYNGNPSIGPEFTVELLVDN
jgi:hypothetical protein